MALNVGMHRLCLLKLGKELLLETDQPVLKHGSPKEVNNTPSKGVFLENLRVGVAA